MRQISGRFVINNYDRFIIMFSVEHVCNTDKKCNLTKPYCISPVQPFRFILLCTT